MKNITIAVSLLMVLINISANSLEQWFHQVRLNNVRNILGKGCIRCIKKGSIEGSINTFGTILKRQAQAPTECGRITTSMLVHVCVRLCV